MHVIYSHEHISAFNLPLALCVGRRLLLAPGKATTVSYSGCSQAWEPQLANLAAAQHVT
jgi:hypothetical protein